MVVADTPPPRPIARPRSIAESVFYELHVKGFTRLHPAVPEHLRGTYAGLAYPAVVQHLVDLGVTAVELLPVHQYVSEPFLISRGLSNYWGYNSLAFFAPHSAYGSVGTLGQQVREFKEMVSALHDAGIEVILDVVYNHTGEGGHEGPTLSFRGLDHLGYYRLTDDQRNDYDVTGCGNSVDTSEPGVLRMVLDSLRYWVTEMGVDGFRFDLVTTLIRDEQHHVDQAHPFKTAIAADPVLSRVKLIAEPWDMGPYGYQVGSFGPGWSEWNDRFRNYVRDFWRGNTHGVAELAQRLIGSPDLFDREGRDASASINFVTAHDGFTMRDLVTYDVKHNGANGESNRDGTDDNRSWNCGVEGETEHAHVNTLRHRQAGNLMATLLLSNGAPMITAGDEIGRTQQGNNNAYCQDSPISWIHWDTVAEWSDQDGPHPAATPAARRQPGAQPRGLPPRALAARRRGPPDRAQEPGLVRRSERRDERGRLARRDPPHPRHLPGRRRPRTRDRLGVPGLVPRWLRPDLGRAARRSLGRRLHRRRAHRDTRRAPGREAPGRHQPVHPRPHRGRAPGRLNSVYVGGRPPTPPPTRSSLALVAGEHSND